MKKNSAKKNIPRDEVISKLQESIATARRVLPELKEEDLGNDFPERIGGNALTIGFFLIHLVSHVNYHLGQINYHRRLIER